MERFEAYVICRMAGLKTEYIDEQLKSLDLDEMGYEKLYGIVKGRVEGRSLYYDKKVPKRDYSTFKKEIDKLAEHRNSRIYESYWKDYLGQLLEEDIK